MLATLSSDIKVYEQRNPKQSQFYKCVEDHFERLENIWDDCYQKLYGFLRPHVMKVIYKYLDCGDLHKGFARVKCCDCNHEYLVAFSCKSRHFCPSCHQRRVVEFGEYLSTEVLEDVPHRQWVFSLPKRLRVYFMYDRKLLAKLSRCVNDALSDYLKQTVTFENATPGIVCAVQTFGDFLNFNPHLHIIATDGCFNENNDFMVGLSPKAEDLIPAFKQAIFKLLLKEGKISNAVIENMNSWIHDGFHVYCGKAIYSWDNEGLERLGQYIVRAPLSQERMTYIPEHQTNDGKAKVIYKGKTSKKTQVFSALDWLARLITHIPNKGEQMVKYYGYYSNKSRGMRKKDEEIQKPNECNDISEIDAEINKLMFSNMKRKKFNKSWAKLIHKVFFIIVIIIVNISGCEDNYFIINRKTSDDQNTSAIETQGSQTTKPYVVTEPQVTDKPQITPTPVPTATSSATSEPAPEKEEIAIVAISAGENHAAAIDNRGVLYTWGQNEYGQLGDGTTTNRSEPKPVPGITNAKAVACGWRSTYVLYEDGLVYSFGEHYIGRDYGDNTLPVAIKELSDIIAIDTKNFDSIALKRDRTVYDWGLHANYGPHDLPEKVEELKDIVSVAVGNSYYLAVDKNREVWTWGLSYFTDIDNTGSTEYYSAFPSKVRDVHNVESACGKEGEILGIHYDGNVTRWGNYKKEILFDSSDVVSISSGDTHFLAVKKDGTVFSWGSNMHGELGGNRTKEDQYEPRMIEGLSGVIDADAGNDFSMVLKEDGTVWAWGKNDYGQLGIGTTEDQLEPHQVKFSAN